MLTMIAALAEDSASAVRAPGPTTRPRPRSRTSAESIPERRMGGRYGYRPVAGVPLESDVGPPRSWIERDLGPMHRVARRPRPRPLGCGRGPRDRPPDQPGLG